MTRRTNAITPLVGSVILVTLYLNATGGGAAMEPVGGDVFGACCYADGTCQEQSIVDCLLAGGEFTDEAVVCREELCPVIGACCLPNGHCHLNGEIICVEALDGIFQGPGTPCAPGVCLTGACCMPDGLCVPVSQGPCLIIGGAWSGPRTLCVETVCPATPACPADITGDGLVGNLDLLNVLSFWGSCPEG